MPPYPYIAYMSKPQEPYIAIKANVNINYFKNNVYGIESLFKNTGPLFSHTCGGDFIIVISTEKTLFIRHIGVK